MSQKTKTPHAKKNYWPVRAKNQPLRSINCEEKKRYPSKAEADIAVLEMIERVLFSSLNAYHCPLHNCFHIGHNRKMSNKEILDRTKNIRTAAA